MKNRGGRSASARSFMPMIGIVVLLSACAPSQLPSAVAPTESHPSAQAETEPAEPIEPGAQHPEALPPPASFDLQAHSIDEPASLWVISNKARALQPSTWQPTDLELPVGVENTNGQPLRAAAARALETMVQQAAQAGHRLGMVSGFRDFDYQSMLYQGYVQRDGQAAADTYSARPGHSEHQTGLAVDVDDFSGCVLNACFGTTPAGIWVAEHAAEYGFVIRYPDGADHITGFTYEPWHLRYVGVELAQEMRASGTATLEEFFGLDPAPGYP